MILLDFMRLETSEQIICEVLRGNLQRSSIWGPPVPFSQFEVESGQCIINNRGAISAHVAHN